MATPVLMPKQGNSVEECLLTSWKVQKGSKVSAGEMIAEIETDKAAFELEAPADGEILELFFNEGDLVPVLVNVAVIGEAGEEIDEFRPDGAQKADVQESAEEPVSEKKEVTENAEVADAEMPAGGDGQVAESADTNAPLSPRARRFLQEHPFNLGAISGSGAEGRIMEKDVRAAYEASPRLSPVAAEKMDAGESVPAAGTGVNRMILAEDMGQATPAAQEAEVSQAAVEQVPLSNIRKLIADRMLQSITTTAQYTLNAEADVSGLLKLRERIKANNESLNLANANLGDMIAYAAVETLKRHPELNAELVDNTLRKHRAVHLAFACDTPRGLMVPVVPNSEQLSLKELSAQMKILARQAIEGKISPDSLQGGTFTISNLGSLGITSFTPVINTPQVAILGVGGIQLKPVRQNGEVAFVEHIEFSLTCNHQVIDGAPGARFLQTLTKIVENFDLICAAG